MDWLPLVLLSLAVLALAVLRGIQAVRHDKLNQRGSEPGQGIHLIHSEYSSGGGGGGHSGSHSVPRDPQEYAKAFVPKEKK